MSMILCVTVSNKKAYPEKYAEIVCGNSDYTVQFAFDPEWSAYPEKTARFVFRRGDTPPQYIDVLFTGDTCPVPALYQIDEVEIGVYAGDIHTTAPARVPCVPCITDGNPMHAEPPQDIYDQLLERLNEIEGGGAPALAATAVPYYYTPAKKAIGRAKIGEETDNGSFD